jgi:signal transduction histidine kinase/ligand-binding sensor domain-containing protein
MKLRFLFKYSIFVIFIFLVNKDVALCQSYFIHNYSVENGLPTSFVYDVTQDKRGRMWFATPSGISVYDGYQWNNPDSKNNLPKTGFRKIYTDEKGIIWCLPLNMCESLVYFTDDSSSTMLLPGLKDESDKGVVTSFNMIYENNKPVLFIGTYSGLYVYKDDAWKNYKAENGLINNSIIKITVYKRKLYITTKGGVSVFDGTYFDNSLNEKFDAEHKEILAIMFENEKNENSESKLWVLGKNWIGNIENNRLNILNNNFYLPSGLEFESPSLVSGADNLIFFGNYYLTFYINKITGQLFPMTHSQGFKSDGCLSIYIDREENIWKAETRGVDKLNNLYLVNYSAADGLQENEVSTIFESEPGKLIIGHNSGVTIFGKDKKTKIDFPKNAAGYPGDCRVVDACNGKDGSVWLACSISGLAKLDSRGNLSWIKSGVNNYVSSVDNDAEGNIWITTNEGIYVLRNGKFEEPSDFKIKKQYYRRILIDKENNIYLASPNGLTVKKGYEIRYYTLKNNERANNIFTIVTDNNSDLLVGTKDGLYILKDNVYKKYNEKGFSIDKSVYSILKDKTGIYWFGTEDGVIKWDGNGKTRLFTKGNGLSGMESNRAALINDSFGNVWIGTESGMTCYRPEFDNNEIPVPKIILSSAEDIEGNKYPLSQNISLKSKIRTLIFNFRGISYYNENFIQYKIKLEGFDVDWYDVSQNQIDKIRYTNLIPGDYVFHVSAKNISGEWSEICNSSVITIEVPYYQKWWFILLTVFLMGSLFYMFYKLYLNRIYYLKLESKVQSRTKELRETERELRSAQTLLEEKVKERTARLGTANELLKETNATKDKFFSIIAHDLKSPFVGLLGYSELLSNEIDSLSKEKVVEYSMNLNKNIKNTYNLLENLLNWALLQTGRMAFSPESLDLYLEIESIADLLSANSSSKNIKILNGVNLNTYIEADRNMIRTVLYNLISNAIKFTRHGGEVCINTKNECKYTVISVSDNGIGIPKEHIDTLFDLDSNISTKGTANEKGTGLGLLLCKEMIEKHKGRISAESEEGKGTTFKVEIPMNNN